MQKKHLSFYTKLILFILPVSLIPSISFGATGEVCLTCGSSPKEFVLINDFTTEMISQIKTIGTSGKYTGKFVPASWFESGKFVAPKQLILSKVLRRAKNSLSMTIGMGNLVQQLGNPISIADEIVILTRNEVFFRDWKKLGLIETAINKKKFELSMGGGWNDEIKGVPLQRMNAIIEKYKEQGIIEDYNFQGAKYYEVLVVLGSINNDLKHLMSMGGTQMAKNRDSSLFSLRFSVKLDDGAIDNIKNAYNCARLMKCSNPFTQFKDLGKGIKAGGSSARQEITSAHERLGVAIKSFGKDVKKRMKDMVDNTKKLWKDSIKKTTDSFKEISDTRSKPFENWRDQKIVSDEKTLGLADKSENKVNTDKINEIAETKVETILQDNIDSIIKEAQNLDDTLTMSAVDDITPYFSELTYKITNLSKNVIGAKGQTDTLIDNLGKVCEKQCTNVGSKKCYY